VLSNYSAEREDYEGGRKEAWHILLYYKNIYFEGLGNQKNKTAKQSRSKPGL